jgi:hypothetical protein
MVGFISVPRVIELNKNLPNAYVNDPIVATDAKLPNALDALSPIRDFTTP